MDDGSTSVIAKTGELGTMSSLFDACGLMAGLMEEAGDDFRFVAGNANTAHRYGVAPADLAGRTGRSLGVTEEVSRAVLDQIDLCHREGPQTTQIKRTVAGADRYMMTISAAAPDSPDGARREVFLSVDITAQRQAENEVTRQQTLMKAALDAADMGVWEFDVASGTITLSSEAAAIIGKSDDAIDLTAFMELVHPDDLDRVSAEQEAAERGEKGGRYRVEHRIKTPGGIRWIETSGRVIFAEDGAPARAVGAIRDIGEQIAARHRQERLADELSHRVMNNLSVVDAIANYTLQTVEDPRAFRNAFSTRISALAEAHEMLHRYNWEMIKLEDLLRTVLTDAAGPLRIEAPEQSVMVAPEQALGLSIIFHELASNAVKHGAHRTPQGEVHLRWSIVGDAVEVQWVERGGPPVRPPSRTGFGMLMLRRGVGARDSAARLEFAPEGLRVSMDLRRSPSVIFEPQPDGP